jgi:DNA-binding response OmpR family regulator
MRILVIEDDKRLSALVRQVLEDEHFAVDLAFDGDSGLEFALRGLHDLAIIDWMLPGRDGPAIVRSIRAARLNLGILMLTARGQVEDRVSGLQAGADDYLVKPFAFDELLARVHALARRVNNLAVDADELRVGEIVLDMKSRTGRRADCPLVLTKTEWEVLEYLMRHPDQVMSRQNILDYVWSYEHEVQASMVDVYVSYLRAKLNQPGRADPIQTIRGVGYRLAADYA